MQNIFIIGARIIAITVPIQFFKSACQLIIKPFESLNRQHSAEYEAEIQERASRKALGLNEKYRTKNELAAVNEMKAEQHSDMIKLGAKTLLYGYTLASLANGEYWPGALTGCALAACESLSNLTNAPKNKV